MNVWQGSEYASSFIVILVNIQTTTCVTFFKKEFYFKNLRKRNTLDNNENTLDKHFTEKRFYFFGNFVFRFGTAFTFEKWPTYHKRCWSLHLASYFFLRFSTTLNFIETWWSLEYCKLKMIEDILELSLFNRTNFFDGAFFQKELTAFSCSMFLKKN